jgi:hypothetical protein
MAQPDTNAHTRKRDEMYQRKRSKLLSVARKMPPCRHSFPGEEFDIKKSEAVRWLIDQPEILNYIWNHIKQSDDIEYDSEMGYWHGADYDD